jgi:hypothetical protein
MLPQKPGRRDADVAIKSHYFESNESFLQFSVTPRRLLVLTMATICPTTSFSTTSAPTTSKTMATTVPMSTSSSKGDYADEAGRNTSTLAGDATAKRSCDHTKMPTSSQISLKHSTELESSSDLSTSDTSSLLGCVKRPQKKKRTKAKKIPTENHLEIRRTSDAGSKWELDLERVHGLTDEQACVCVSIAAQHLQNDIFPPPNGDRLVELAREGWKHLREVDRLIKLYPECGDQTNIDGEWIMI